MISAIRTEPLVSGFKLAQMMVATNLDGLTDGDSFAQPQNGGNCLNWVAGHMLFARGGLLAKLGGDSLLTADQAAVYNRGSQPLTSVETSHVPLEQLRDGLQTAAAQIIERIAALDEEALDRQLPPEAFPVPVDKPTFESLLYLLLMHDAYHAGQLGLLRRIAGKPAAIR